MAGFDTKPNFNSQKFEQCAGDIMNLSGCTQIFSILDMESGSTLSVCNGATFNVSTDAGIDKILRSDADGNGTWINIPITDAVNGLTVSDGTVLLGGSLIQETEIDLNSNQFTITNQNPPFTIGTGFDEVVTAVVEDGDGKYLVAGRFHDYSGVTANGLIRLNSDGTVDDTLDTGAGFTKPDTTTGISPMAIDANGKILVAGSFTQYDGASHPYIVRLCTDGTYDSSFTPPTSSSVINGGRVIYIKDNGKILVGGDFDKHLIQLCSDGTVDTSFNVGTGFAGGQTGPNPYTFVLDIAEQSDGKLIIGGDYTSYNGNNAGHLIRLCSDGSYDDTFDTYPGFNRRVKNISIESDGKILLVGEFTGYTATTAHNSSGIAKLNSDGTYDTSYDVGDGFTGSTGTETYHIGGHKILKQINNQTLITGYFTWYNGSDVSGIVRLNTDATIDTDFDSGTGFDSIPNDSIVTSTGKFLLGGNFTEYDGTSFNRIVRLSYYGELDNQAVDSMVVFNGKVIEYGDNYASYYTNRSLVDKEYVDTHVSGATSGITVNNGLCNNSGIIGLGGTLCKHTDIDTSTFNLSISNLPAQTDEETVLFIGTDGVIVTGASTGGCGDYAGNSPSTCTVGGITSGTVLTGQTLEHLIQEMLAPYIEPTFSSFTSASIASPMEVGTTLAGTKTFNWGTTTGDNVASNSIGICEVGGALLGSGLANDGAEALDIGTKTNTSPTIWTWQITGCSTQDTAFSRNMTKCSVYPYYWGVETCATRPGVDNTLVNGGTKVYTCNSCSTVTVDFNSSAQWTWVAIPANNPSTVPIKTCWYITPLNNSTMGNPGDKYPDVCTLDITSGDGCWSAVSYNVYMSNLAGSDADPIQFRNS